MGIEELIIDRATKQGLQQGEEKKSYEFARNLMLQTDFGDRKIAELMAVSVAFVQKVRAELNEKSK